MSVDKLFNNGLRLHIVEAETLGVMVGGGIMLVGLLIYLVLWLMERRDK